MSSTVISTGAYQLVSSWAATLVPEISVEYPSGTNLVSGVAIVEFGTLALGADVTRTFTVRNPGTGPLTGIAPSFMGGNAADFAVTSSPASSVVAGGFTSFTVRLAPSVIGRRATTLRVASNDANENPFEIWLTGEVTPPRQLFDGVAASSRLTGSNALPAAVPYGDGVKNLIKYAFNMSLGSSGYRTLSAGTGTSGCHQSCSKEAELHGSSR